MLVSLAVLLSGVRSALADSPKPTPRTTPNGQRETTAEQKPTSAYSDQAGSYGAPTSAASVSNLSRPTESPIASATDEKATEQERHDRREETLENRLVWLTAILAAIEVVTLVIFYFTMTATQTAAYANKASADRLAEQIKLTTRANIKVYAGTLANRPQTTTVDVDFTVVNEGHTDAQVILQRFAIWIHPLGLPWPTEIPTAKSVVLDTLLPQKFEAYDSREGRLTMTILSSIAAATSDWAIFNSGGSLLCLSGRVQYIDETGKRREFRFCRNWSRNDQQFIVNATMPNAYNRST